MADLPKFPTKVRIIVSVIDKPYRTYEGFDEEDLLRQARILSSELTASGVKGVEVKTFRQITG